MTETKVRTEYVPLMLHLCPALEMNGKLFFEFCRINDELRIERTAGRDLEIMPPTGGGTGHRNVKLWPAWMRGRDATAPG